MVWILCLVLSAAAWTEDQDVLVLTDQDFHEAIHAHRQLLVEFYAPWCGHCKSLAPEYAKAASRLKVKGLRIAKVDSTENPEVTAEFSVSGYPTLKFFENGVPSDFDGGRTADKIVSWVTKKAGPSIVTVDSLDELKSLLAASPVVAVFFATAEGVDSSYFEKTAAKTDGVEFVICKNSEAKEVYSLKKDGAIVLFKHFDEPKLDYLGPVSASALSSFLDKKKRRSALEFGEEVIELVFQKYTPSLMVFRANKAADQHAEAISAVGRALKDDLLVTYADLSEETNQRLAEYLGISASDMPFSFIVKASEGEVEKYKGNSDLSEAGLLAFVQKWKNQELRKHLKSAEAPEDPYEGAVRVLVGSTFNEVVYDTTKDVLVEFYAPWCGHCKSLAPEYEKAAEYFQGHDHIVLAKVDSTENEIEGHPVNSYPVLKFFPRDNKAGVDYDGGRNAEGLIEYFKKNSKDLQAIREEL
jgi:protein disulfide-isomerase A1